MDVVNMDFSKAFDEVPHDRLIQKNVMHTINSDLVVCVQNKLIDRRERELCWKDNIQAGDLQGCVLGPLQFVISINDLNVYIDVSKLGGCQNMQCDIDQLQ